MQTSPEAWREWWDRCALGLCSETTRGALKAFAASRFDVLVRRYLWRTNQQDSRSVTPAADACWHLFETRLCVHENRAGKRYKDWLFGRVDESRDEPLDVIQGGATLLMRDVVREYLRREYAPAQAVSLQASYDGVGDSACTLEDLLPGSIDPAHEAGQRELTELAEHYAAEAFSSMRRREKIAILAKALHLSLAHPACTALAGCAKSSLNNAHRTALEGVVHRLRLELAEEDPCTVRQLTLMTLRALAAAACTWGKLEKDCAALFRVESESASSPRWNETAVIHTR